MNKKKDLFFGNGSDEAFLTVRDKEDFFDIKDECERLWHEFEPYADKNFDDQFSRQFHHRFWEMCLMVQLSIKHGLPEKSKEKGPDFKFGKDQPVYVEATVPTRGNDPDSEDFLTDISKRDDKDEDSVPSSQAVLRIISSLKEKSNSNNSKEVGSKHPYIIAINLPYLEVGIEDDPPLSAQACLGYSGSLTIEINNTKKTTRKVYPPKNYIEKANGSKVEVKCFHDMSYSHISALLLTSVNPFWSSYPKVKEEQLRVDPNAVNSNIRKELLHNPNAINPLDHGWLNFGSEYWIQDNSLLSHYNAK